MVGRFNMILQGIRDAALIVVSVLTMSTSHGILASEPLQQAEPAYLVFGVAAAFLVISIINIILLLKKVKTEAYFYFNTVIQLLPSFVLALYSLWIGPVFLVLNVAILITLIERKKKGKHRKND